jgi:hypothetical protein
MIKFGTLRQVQLDITWITQSTIIRSSHNFCIELVRIGSFGGLRDFNREPTQWFNSYSATFHSY